MITIKQTWATLAGIGIISFASINAEPVDSRDPTTIAEKARETTKNSVTKSGASEPDAPADPRKPTTLAPDNGMDYAASNQSKNIAELVMASEKLSKLEEAVVAAGLTDTLMGEGPYTVFAPSDEAFADVPEEALEDLMLPENKEKLKALLLAHVVPGKMTANQVKTGTPSAVSGDQLNVVVSDDGVMVSDAKVTRTDIEASNGVIHVIDTVIMPE